jgi:hypothetical protein
MVKRFEVTWEGALPAAPQDVWDAMTKRSAGYLWPVEYEPRVGGAERGLNSGGGTVTAWEPATHFGTRSNTGFNELDYRLEPRGPITYLRYRHRTDVPADEFDVQLDACRRHTTFYLHSLGQYACHFAGRDAAYMSVDVGAGFADVRRALGVSQRAVVGDRVTLTPAGLGPIEGVVDYATGSFLGVRGADALVRVYGRDVWGWGVEVAVHDFAGAPDEAAWAKWAEEVA